MTTIAEFIEARIVEREDAAKFVIEMEQNYNPAGHTSEYEWAKILVKPDGKRQGSYTFEAGAPSPHEVLRQCAALRELVGKIADEATGLDMQVDGEFAVGPRDYDAEPLLGDLIHRNVAAIWSTHPDYREAVS